MSKILQINAVKKGGRPSPPMGSHPILPSASSVPRVHEGQVLPSPLSSPRQPPLLAQPSLPIPSLLTLPIGPPSPSVKTSKAPPVPHPLPPNKPPPPPPLLPPSPPPPFLS